MTDSFRLNYAIVAMAIKLVQPGRLGDVISGLKRLTPAIAHNHLKRDRIRELVGRMRENRLVKLYEGQRYILTPTGEQLVTATKLRHQVEARRMYLLKETRRSID